MYTIVHLLMRTDEIVGAQFHELDFHQREYMFGGWLYGNYYPFLCKQLEEIRKHNFKTTYTSNSKSSFPNTTPRRPTIRPLVIFFYLKTIDIPLFHWRVLTDIYTEFLENLVSIQSMHLGLSLHQLILYI